MWFIDFSCKGFLLFSLTILSLPSPFYTIYGVRFYKVWEGNRHETRRKRYWLDLNVDSEAEERSERDDADAARPRYLLFYTVKDFFPRLWMVAFSLLRYWCLWSIFLWNMYLFSLLRPWNIDAYEQYTCEICTCFPSCILFLATMCLWNKEIEILGLRVLHGACQNPTFVFNQFSPSDDINIPYISARNRKSK
jgi:hypothetical protein